jgi:hypothetical protein
MKYVSFYEEKSNVCPLTIQWHVNWMAGIQFLKGASGFFCLKPQLEQLWDNSHLLYSV